MTDLAGRIRTRPGLPAMTDQHLFDVVRRDAGAGQSGPRGDGPQFGRVNGAERPAVAPDRRTRGTHDDDVCLRHNLQLYLQASFVRVGGHRRLKCLENSRPPVLIRDPDVGRIVFQHGSLLVN